MDKTAKVLFTLIFFVFVIPLFILIGIKYFNKDTGSQIEVFCTMDAKMCPDGSFVGRVAPSCEFESCSKVVESNSAKINQKILNDGVYITPLEVVSDSRCPTSVTCIWAGTVSIKVKLHTEGEEQDSNLELNKSVTFAGKVVSLTEVAPFKIEAGEINNNDYVFTFSVN